MNAWTQQALADIAAERIKQDQKWGEQRHRFLPPYVDPQSMVSLARQEADTARTLCQGDTGGNDNWLHILDEEYREMQAEMWAGNIPALREELVQTAAVIVNMIETIDKA